MLRRRPAAEKPPLSATWTNAVRLVSRSIGASDYPSLLDNASDFSPIITSHAASHLRVATRRASEEDAYREDVMSNLSYAPDLQTKTGLRPSFQAVKRAALGLAMALAVAGAADLGYRYLTTWR